MVSQATWRIATIYRYRIDSYNEGDECTINLTYVPRAVHQIRRGMNGLASLMIRKMVATICWQTFLDIWSLRAISGCERSSPSSASTTFKRKMFLKLRSLLLGQRLHVLKTSTSKTYVIESKLPTLIVRKDGTLTKLFR